MTGVDLNQYRNLPDYKQLWREGYDFAIIKLATGVTFRNPLFEKQYDGCKNAGLYLGVYTRADNILGDGKKDAKFALDILGDRKVDLPIYYDVEGNTLKYSKAELTKLVLDFGETITNAGYRWGLYTSKAHFKLFDISAIKTHGASIWCAAYNSDSPEMDCDIWQKTSGGMIAGYNENIDIDELLNTDILKEETRMAYTNSPLVSYTLISPNRSSPREHKIDTITIHCFVGQVGVERGCQVFQPTSKAASCNYVVAYDGKIGLVVEEKDRSWCSSSPTNDARAVTIEVACDPSHPYVVTDAAYNALIDLVTDICQRNGIRGLVWSNDKNSRINHLLGCNMTVHRDYANKACPGQYLYERHCAIADAVNKRLGIDPKAARVYKPEDMPTVYEGCSGEAVVMAQNLLAKNGFPCTNGGADGIFGAGTKKTVIAFQKAKGLDADGVIGLNTWRALFAILETEKPAEPEQPKEEPFDELRMGDVGERVKMAQEKLLAEGYDLGESGADGFFGPKTRKAMRQYQLARHLIPNGNLTKEVWDVMNP